MEKRTRYNELLGIPNSIRDPDLYQLLGLERASLDAALVEERYRERMSTLQAIKSPKHKSFIEFLKGELRRARAVLVDEKQRREYDRELFEERREQLTRILDIVLADGVLRATEERRFQDMAAEVGLSPDEVETVLRDELQRRGARRDSSMGPVAAPPTPPPAPGRAAGSSDIQRAIGRAMPSRPTPPPRPAAPPRPATPQRPAALGQPAHPESAGPGAPHPASPYSRPGAVSPRPGMGAPGPEPTPFDDEEEEVVAELVEEAPPEAAARFRSETKGAAGWGRATVVRVIGVCSSCLTDVIDQDVTMGRAERLEDGRLHCPACFNRLVAGLICGACYQRVTRSDMKGGRLKVIAGRVHHAHCIGG